MDFFYGFIYEFYPKDQQTKEIGIEKDYLLTILNNVQDNKSKSYQLDYSFYRRIIRDTIDVVKPEIKQSSLFG